MVVPVQTGQSYQAGSPQVFFEAPRMHGSGLVKTYDVTPDGRRFVMSRNPESTEEPLQIDYIPDWFEELEQIEATAPIENRLQRPADGHYSP